MKLDQKIIKAEAKDYIGITFGLIMYSFGFTFFLMPYEIVTGGVAGIAAITQYATQIPNQYTYFLVNAALLIVGLKILGWKFLMKTIYAIFTLKFLLGLMKEFVPRNEAGEMIKILGEGQDFMSLIIGCMLTGSAMGLIFVNNGSTGGSDIIAASVNKYYNMSLGMVLVFVDFVVIGSCLFIPQFGTMLDRLYMVVFGFCTMIIENFMLDYVYNRQRSSVQFLIFSEKWQEIAYEIGTVHRPEAQRALHSGEEKRESGHLPHHQDHRPACLRVAECRHRRLWRGLRRHKTLILRYENRFCHQQPA